MTDLLDQDATAMAEAIRRKELSRTELVQAAIDRAERLNPRLNAIIHERYDRALKEAESATGPFAGVPIVMKDFDGPMAGEPLHGGMNYLKKLKFTEQEDSHMLRRLKNAGFVVIGKTNTPELGLLPITEPDAYGPTRNPWNPDHAVGGSSGGSAAAVAAGIVPVGHAGDGGGSIRIPASMCGLVGLKPSRGRVSLGPLEGENWAGFVVRHVLVRSVRDSARILDIVAGREVGDPYSAAPPPVPFAVSAQADPGTLRIGVMRDFPGGRAVVGRESLAAVEETAARLVGLGHHVEDAYPKALDDPYLYDHLELVIGTWVSFELDMWSRRGGVPITQDDVEEITWRYNVAGRKIIAADYISAVDAVHAWSRRAQLWWDDYDLLLTPTMAALPPRIGEYRAGQSSEYPNGNSQPYAGYTGPFNFTGQPAISLPVHMSESGLPVGVQLVAAAEREDLLLAIAAKLEETSNWSTLAPTP